jgi:hypothetical protein
VFLQDVKVKKGKVKVELTESGKRAVKVVQLRKSCEHTMKVSADWLELAKDLGRWHVGSVTRSIDV